jgi:hypothetical protein
MAAGWVDDRWYVIQWRPKSRKWCVLWLRNSRDKPTISRFSKPGDRETQDAAFDRIEFAEEYVRLITSGEDHGRFDLHDA